jgi:hypothetical protein
MNEALALQAMELDVAPANDFGGEPWTVMTTIIPGFQAAA